MKKNLFSLGLLGAVAMFAACNPTSAGYTVSGTLPDSTLNGKTVYILNVDNGECVDSTVVEGNAYVFKGQVDTALVASFSINGRSSMAVFALENGDVTITDNGDSKGTPLNDELTRVSASLDSINTEYYKAYEAFEGSREEWAAVYETAWVPRFKQQVLDCYQGHTNDVVGYVLTQFLSILSVDEQLDMMNGFGPWLASTKRVSTTKNTLETQKKTAVGQPYTDVQGTDVNGNPVSLSDYVGKGNYVLVDMWASWCGPCKREIPNLAKLHNLYKDKGLTVLGIYVWDKIENLAPAMEAEKITWPQIIDSNETATKLYGVQGIPCIMLISPDGKILDRTNLRGDNMQPMVEKYMFGK
ncbi:MAG: AhpC/TSA family protein [Bacteroidaceae bacterium]|nr:AhpC/TSA family protein [Bacteroidaceae bacterium]